jgi:hypothetical protein
MEPGTRVKPSALYPHFPRGKRREAGVFVKRTNGPIVQVKWDNLSTPESLHEKFVEPIEH